MEKINKTSDIQLNITNLRVAEEKNLMMSEVEPW